MSRDDAALLSDWQVNRDESALRSLCERHAVLARTSAARAGASEPEEVAQAVFILLAHSPGRIPPAHIAGWIVQASRNLAANQRRRAAARRRHEDAAAKEQAMTKAASESDRADWEPSLDLALAELTPARREAVIRFHMQGQAQAAIAADMGCSVAAVKMRIHEGLAQMRASLGKRGFPTTSAALAGKLALPASSSAGESHLSQDCLRAGLDPASASGAQRLIASLPSPIAPALIVGIAAAGFALGAIAWLITSRNPSASSDGATITGAVATETSIPPPVGYAGLLDQPVSLTWRHAPKGLALAMIDSVTWLRVREPLFTPDDRPEDRHRLKQGVFSARPLQEVLDAYCADPDPAYVKTWRLVGDHILILPPSQVYERYLVEMSDWADGLPASVGLVFGSGMRGFPFFVGWDDRLPPEPRLHAAFDRVARRINPRDLPGQALVLFAKAGYPWARSAALHILNQTAADGDRAAENSLGWALHALQFVGMAEDIPLLLQRIDESAAHVPKGSDMSIAEAMRQSECLKMYEIIAWIIRQDVGAKPTIGQLTDRLSMVQQDGWQAFALANSLALLGAEESDQAVSRWLDRTTTPVGDGPMADTVLQSIINVLERWKSSSPTAMALWTVRAARAADPSLAAVLSKCAYGMRSPAITPLLIEQYADSLPRGLRSLMLIADQSDPASERLVASSALRGEWTKPVVDAVRAMSRQPDMEEPLLEAARGSQVPTIDAILDHLSGSTVASAARGQERSAWLIRLLRNYQTTATAAEALRLDTMLEPLQVGGRVAPQRRLVKDLPGQEGSQPPAVPGQVPVPFDSSHEF